MKPADAPYQDGAVITWCESVARSFETLLKRPLVTAETPEKRTELLYKAPFILVSHGMEKDPVFHFANLAAQSLWKMDWNTLVGMPSRLTAEPVAQEKRQQLLTEVMQKGYVEHYQAVRIASDGARFMIEDTIIWNVSDPSGTQIGQAAMFEKWSPCS